MKNVALILKKSKDWKYLVLVLCLFQSCQFGNPSHVDNQVSINSLHSSNGSGYDGKLSGQFSRSFPDQSCDGPRGSINVGKESSMVTSVSESDCQEDVAEVSPDQIHFSPYNSTVVGYAEGLYVANQKFNSFIDSDGFSELWCQARSNEMEGIDIIIEHNPLHNQTVATILLGSSVGDGKFEVRQVSKIVLDRLRTTDTLSYSYEDLFSLKVTSGSFQNNGITFYPGQMLATIDGVKHNKAFDCQRGGWLDLEYQRLFVEPTYPINGALWNHYLGNREGVIDPAMGRLADVGCEPDDLSNTWNSCVHVGDHRKVRVKSHASCAGLTMTDSIAVFDWVCQEDRVRQEVVFFSQGLNHGSGLADILQPSQWALNQVILRENGKLINSSDDTIWWNNAVKTLPENLSEASSRVTLNDPFTIYTLAQVQSSKGYDVQAEGIALVTLDGGRLEAHAEMAADCPSRRDGLGEKSNVCLVSSNGARGLWIEGEFVGHYGLDTVLHMNSDQVRLNSLKVRRSRDRGIFVGGHLAQITDVEVSEALNHGLKLPPWTHAQSIERLSAFNNGDGEPNDAGVFIGDFVGSYEQRSRMIDSNIFNNQGHGIVIEIEGMEMQNIVVAGNQRSGLSIGKKNNIVMGVLAYDNGADGLLLQGDGSILKNVTSIHNGGSGIRWAGTTDFNQAFNLLVAYNRVGLTNLGESNEVTQLLMSNNSDLAYLGAAHAEEAFATANLLVGDATSDCAMGSLSENVNVHCSEFLYGSGKLVTGVDLTGVFAPPVVPSASFPLPRPNRPGLFVPISVSKLSSLRWATKIKNESTPCPMELHGNGLKYFSGQSFLSTAFEIVGDEVGDDDGLCESNETCIYSQFYGAYQGQGALDTSCEFSQSSAGGEAQLSNIKILAPSEDL